MKRISTWISSNISLPIFVSVFIMPLGTFAQKSYLPILEVGKRWTYINYAVSGELHEPAVPWAWEAIDMNEENGHQVFTLLYQDPETNSGIVGDPFTKTEYEVDGVLWSFSYEDWTYQPMIDFNLEVGDTVRGIYEIVWKGYVDIEGVMRCVIALENPGWGKRGYWIEGIGAIDDMYLSPVIMVIGERTHMTECWMGDTCLFDYNRMDSYISEVKPLTSTQTAAPRYDILGRRISESAPGQLYIQGGKKHIAK